MSPLRPLATPAWCVPGAGRTAITTAAETPIACHYGVELYSLPWVAGTRVAVYFGPICVRLLSVRGDDMAYERVLRVLARKASDLGANAVVRVDITAEPLELTRWYAMGTAARLEPMWV